MDEVKLNPKVIYVSARIGGSASDVLLSQYFARKWAEKCEAERTQLLESVPSLPAIDEDDINSDER